MGFTESDIERLIAVATKYGVTRLVLFGSALDNLTTVRNIDLACDGVPGWRLYALAAEMEEIVGGQVDLVPLSPFTAIIERKERCLI